MNSKHFALILLSTLLLSLSATPGAAKSKKASEATKKITEPVPATTPVMIDHEKARHQALAAELLQTPDSNNEIIWLGQADNQYLGLFSSNHNRSFIGNIILLHDNQQHPDWPGVIHQLRTELPGHGWTTLSIAVPDTVTPPTIKMPTKKQLNKDKADTQAEPFNEMESATQAMEAKQKAALSTKAAEHTPTQVGLRIQEGIQFLKKKNRKPIVIVAVGISASWAANRISKMPLPNISGLVMIDAEQTQLSPTYNLSQDTAALKTYTLDIVPEFNQRSNHLQRKQATIRSRHPRFQQRIIPGAHGLSQDNAPLIVKTVRGWVTRIFKRQ